MFNCVFRYLELASICDGVFYFWNGWLCFLCLILLFERSSTHTDIIEIVFVVVFIIVVSPLSYSFFGFCYFHSILKNFNRSVPYIWIPDSYSLTVCLQRVWIREVGFILQLSCTISSSSSGAFTSSHACVQFTLNCFCSNIFVDYCVPLILLCTGSTYKAHSLPLEWFIACAILAL